MIKPQALKFLAEFLMLFFMFTGCKLKKSEKEIELNNKSSNSITDFFKHKNWQYPLHITEDSVEVKFYLDSNTKYQNQGVSMAVSRMNRLYKDKIKFFRVINTIIPLNDAEKNGYGYVASHPQVLIDTIFEGTKGTPAILYSLNIDNYSLNGTNSLMPCEGCVFVEDRKIQKRSSWLLLKYNNDSFYFNRWNN